jgi:hypothetical protein
LSKGRAEKLISINEGTDLSRSDHFYPKVDLPSARDLCELAEVQRACYEPQGEVLEGATIDISDAYRQFTVSIDAIMNRTVMIVINGVQYIVFALCGWFGDTRAGHAYNLTGSYIDFRHHQFQPQRRSLTYVDDGMLIDAKSRLQGSREEYKRAARDIHGPEAVSAEKDIVCGQDMVGIGWHLNLRYEVWRISPKAKAIDKIFTALFFRIPLDICNEDKVFKLSRRTFLEIAGLLSWYSEVLCVGKAFVHSLFACAEWGNMEALHTVSLNAKRDIGWWRIISVASMKDAHFMSTPITHLRRNVETDVYLISDASTTVGGGGWFSQTNIYDENETPSFEAFIRWTPEELQAFTGGISINVLEYFMVIYMVMLRGNELRGKRIGIKCDNTAAVAWLQKSRASNKSPVGECLVQVFSLYCIFMNIVLVPSHLAGVLNIRADRLSRDLLLQELKAVDVDLKDKRWWHGQSREAICRLLLRASISMPSSAPSNLRLELLRALL